MWCNTKEDEYRPLESILEEIAQHYVKKYGHRPSVCHINPKNNSLEHKEFSLDLAGGTMKVLVKNNIPLHHYWMGTDDLGRDSHE